MILQRPYTKKEIATSLRITTKTLSKLLNIKYFEELKKLGYKKTDKFLYADQLEVLKDKIGFYIPDSK